MEALGPWTDADFEALSWHDVPVYGFRFDNFSDIEGTSDVIFDIDYILKWKKVGDGFEFEICRAELRFMDVFGFKAELDYATPTAGMCPFSIHEIIREPEKKASIGVRPHWRISISWPSGEIAFQASGFRQSLVGKPQISREQKLDRKNG